MPSNKNRKKKSATEIIVKKYAMSPEDLAKHPEKVAKTKAKYSMDQAKVEEALTDFLNIKDPIVFKGKAIAWVKRPSMKQLKAMIPKELRPYVDNPQDVPEKVNKKYESFFYEKMAELIVIPERTAEEWEDYANPWFVRMFWEHIANIAKLMEGPIEGF